VPAIGIQKLLEQGELVEVLHHFTVLFIIKIKV
jgi:hypothetical protein